MIRIATRRSPLAKWQANHVADRLRRNEPGLEVRLHELVTRGDKILDVPLADVGGKGLFVKEIEDALLNREAEIAVHSMKDLPAELAPGLLLASVPVREDPRRPAEGGARRDLQPPAVGPAQGAAAGSPARGGARQRRDSASQGLRGA